MSLCDDTWCGMWALVFFFLLNSSFTFFSFTIEHIPQILFIHFHYCLYTKFRFVQNIKNKTKQLDLFFFCPHFCLLFWSALFVSCANKKKFRDISNYGFSIKFHFCIGLEFMHNYFYAKNIPLLCCAFVMNIVEMATIWYFEFLNRMNRKFVK